MVFEATSLNVETGQPAIDHIRAALEHGAHAITANKGPIVHAYRELRDLAASARQTVPVRIHGHGRHPHLLAFRPDYPRFTSGLPRNPQLHDQRDPQRNGAGLSFDEALQRAQDLGVAETDATHDIDGWDAAVKTAALITVLMDVPISLEDSA